MADNLRFYNACRSVPENAQKDFNNGRFSGTDINPMWRIKVLPELFGPVGLGWYYEVTSERAETVGDTVMAIVDLNLYIRDPANGEWSKPIFGTGGNVLLAKGRASDEGYKMALTDALSVACKALGVGADIYYAKDKTKYTAGDKGPMKASAPTDNNPAPGKQVPMEGIETGTCKMCKKQVPIRELEYAKEKYGHALCRECQKGYEEYKRQQAEKAGKEQYA